MKQLFKDLKDTLTIAEPTDTKAVVQRCSLTKDDSKTITATANALIVQDNLTKDDLLESLQSVMNLSKCPTMTSRTVFLSDGYGADFVPDKVDFGSLTEQQRQTGLEFVNQMKRPMSVEGIKNLYTRLRLTSISRKDADDIDNATRMAIYIDEMRKFPANVVRSVMKQTYEYFPTLNELICDCEREERLLNAVERGLK